MGKISLEKYERGRVLLEFYSKFPKDELAKQLMLSFEQYIKWVHVNATGIEYDMTDSHKRVAKALQDIADGLNVKRNLALALPVGCVTGDTLIRINRHNLGRKVKIKDAYRRWIGLDKRYAWDDEPMYIRRYIESEDRIKLSGCNEIVWAGVKPVWKVTLEDGKSIKATIDHPFLTKEGYVALGSLKIGDEVMVDNVKGKTKTSLHEDRNLHRQKEKHKCVGGYYPNATMQKDGFYKVIEYHRAVYEANMNGMTLEEFCEATRHPNNLKYLDPKVHVHHIDGNHSNNDISNLEALSPSEHRRHHETYSHFHYGIPEYSKVKSVEYVGEEDTYCCICDTIWGEEPNFSANDIMIHNFGKSLIVQYWITWCFARNKQCMFCYIAYADKLIKKLSKEARDIIGSEFWISVFGNELRADDKSKLNFSLNSGGKRTGLTAGTMSGGILGLDAGNPSAVGFGGALIIDDPLPTEAMSSEYLREDAKDIYHAKLETRRRTPTTPTVLLMQRLHKDDLIGHLKETEPEDWEFIDVPALNPDGTSFYPSRFPVRELENIKARSPYKFYAMYQQDPINYGGTVFKQEWIQTVDVIPQKFKKVIITSDTAMKAGENNDYSVFQCWGLGEDNNAYLLDQIRGKWEAPELLKQAIMFFKKCKTRFPKLHRFYVEDKASGTGLIQTIKRQTLISICPIKRGANKNKVERANDVTCHFECGRVFFYKFLGNMGELVSELLAFDAEMNHKHDDQVDCLTDALTILLNQKSNSIFI